MTADRTDPRSLPQLLAASTRPLRSLLADDRLRWWGFGVVTVLGWIAIALWLAAVDPAVSPADDSIGFLLLVCGLVGTGQALFVLPLQGDQGKGPRPRRRPRKRRGRQTQGTWLLRWWQWLLLIAAHALIVIVLAVTLIPQAGDAWLEAVFDVLFLGGLVWIVAPLGVFTILVVLGLFLGLVVVGVARVHAGLTAPEGAALTRARALSGGAAMLGTALALVCLVAAIPFMGLHFHGGKGAGLVAIVILLLEAVRIVPGPPGWLHELDRDGYLLGVVAIVQYATFRLWGPRIWRDAPHASTPSAPDDGLPPAQA
ncbi:hypothetical protein P5G50_01935 [Leifsonia sp. F6_8S_P_1B]|uniref:Uncharacterized protein n=1 Tax=Leifsonia williamsii TaxID=3035919 RepID=A0ABT8KA58_9MICO|nr:hypothetical protein [Leifsonia williamsii]MDN4613199.1 hypothetical protein [Leifsonia williamsii]